jgi:hypothetical protein
MSFLGVHFFACKLSAIPAHPVPLPHGLVMAFDRKLAEGYAVKLVFDLAVSGGGR